MRRIVTTAFAASLLTAAAAVAILLWPLHANGVTGSALMPNYGSFGWATYNPVPDPATNDDLRRAGVRLPIDVVWHRRHIAIGLLGGAVALCAVGATGLIVGQRRRRQGE